MRENPTVEFGGGGLGDLLLRSYRTDVLEVLADAERPHNVVMMCNNPCAMELFRWHPNRKNLILFDLHHKWLEFQDPGDPPEVVIQRVYEFLGLPLDLRVGRQRISRKPLFHSLDTIDDSGHIVFQPYAGLPGRCLPPDLIKGLLEVFASLDRRVYVITRSYLRAGGQSSLTVVHGNETFPFDLPSNVTHRSDLSVPATLQLLQRSSGYVGAHSSLALVAWLEELPTVVFHEPGNKDFDRPGHGYAFGAQRADCYHAAYPLAELSRVVDTVGRGSLTRRAALPMDRQRGIS